MSIPSYDDSDAPLRQSAGLLLDVVRRALASAVSEGRGHPPEQIPRTSPLDEPSGVFVTLRSGTALRGCIGLPYPDLPMVEAAWQAAQQAALEDPRFPPVTEDELAGLTVEISILSPPESLGAVEDFELGRDGAILEVAGRRSLYLPGVATETGWSRDEFFDHLAMKAGLPAEAWRLPEAEIWRFRTVTTDGAALPGGEA
jgi:AmmeMemoRadiSam system protein A